MSVKEIMVSIDGKMSVEDDLGVTRIVDLANAVFSDPTTNKIPSGQGLDALRNTLQTGIPAGTKVALVGDSRFFQEAQGGRDQTIWLYNVNSLLGGRINVVQHIASGGKWLTNSLTEQFAIARSDIGCFITDFGINDILLSRKNLSELKAYHIQIMNWIKERNVYWIDTTTTTCNALTSDERGVLSSFNAWRLSNDHGYSKYYCVDISSRTSKPDLTNIVDNWHADGLHLNIQGAWNLAYDIYPEFDKLFEPIASDNLVYQFFGNPTLSGAVSSSYGPVPEGLGVSADDGATVVSSIDYSKNPAGSWKLVVTGSGPDSVATISAGALEIANWSSARSVAQVGVCFKPTVPNGFIYKSLNTGELSSGADPTANWPAVKGASTISGSVHLVAIPAVDFQTHQLDVHADFDWVESTGLAGITFINYQFNSAGGFVGGTFSPSFASGGKSIPYRGTKLRVGTGGIALPVATTKVSPQLLIHAPTGVTTTVWISSIVGKLN